MATRQVGMADPIISAANDYLIGPSGTPERDSPEPSAVHGAVSVKNIDEPWPPLSPTYSQGIGESSKRRWTVFVAVVSGRWKRCA